MPLRQRGSWYRGGVSRSYVPPSIFVSVWYAVCLGLFAFFFVFSGSIMTAVSSGGVFSIIGPVALGLGFLMLLISITLCVVVVVLAKKQEKKRHQRQEPSQPLTGIPYPQPPDSAYPHQSPPPPPQNLSPTAPAQQGGQFPPGNDYLPENQNPLPPSYYPPTSAYSPPYEPAYTSTDYSKPMSNEGLQSNQYVPSTNQPDDALTKKPF